MKNIIFILLGIFFFVYSAAASNYPQTKLEKEINEIGSLIGGGGVSFKPQKTKNTDTYSKIGNVNKYLYESTLDILKFAPLISADSKGGTVITEWYTPAEQKNIQFKIHVYIKSELITPEALEVKAFKREKIKGKWSSEHKPSSIASIIEDKILRRARDLYLKSKK